MVLGGFALGVIAIFLPPLPVLWRTGCGANFVINILLLFLGWLPAVFHAWYVILEYPNIRQRVAARRDEKELRRRSRSMDGPASSRDARYSYDDDYRMQRLEPLPPPARDVVYEKPRDYRDALPAPRERLALPPPEQPYYNDYEYDDRPEYVGRQNHRY